ncbi:pyridoxine/pyridoxal/pyridoxamine kinase [Luteimonas sp. MC1895]|uniref:pyridoxine/pyridoxal/pyridoxamine kinase n=1 Tax=Luteimonas sp. MC1895 TaxID=2819513 RepID=UPI0018F0F2A2|nr:pyridoxine/pyridoxal/pyridoxamine kinase [Luteimonas sp. MC1895]MBJ6977878.1 pyridoxine/pyridoxal/pyridoxamine kinase [Luteimonas sp. MC1895]
MQAHDPGARAAAPGAHPSLQPMQMDVVSVQSQVVYGQVGNTIAVPTFQSLGLRVAAVPTVVLSNTPHHPSIHGGPVPTGWFQGYLDDLVARDAVRELRAVVVGYLGGPEQAGVLARWIEARLRERPGLSVFIDPVIGDEDVGIYVDPRMIDAHCGQLVGLADGLVPNGFELGVLTGMSVADTADVVHAARSLLVGRTRWVVVTSAAPAAWGDGGMKVLVVQRDAECVIRHRRLDATPKGTGDLFSATLAAHLLRGAPVEDAARLACDRVLAVLDASQAAGSAEMLVFPEPG